MAGKYPNSVNITSGRKVLTATPFDDRMIFHDVAALNASISAGEYTAWYNGMVVYVHELNDFYAWRLSDNAANTAHPDETNPNPHINYDIKLLTSDYRYAVGYPDPKYAGYYFNWYLATKQYFRIISGVDYAALELAGDVETGIYYLTVAPHP